MSRPRPILLLILDGWGHRVETEHNAIAQANCPNWRRLLAECPHTLVDTHGEHVGLPEPAARCPNPVPDPGPYPAGTDGILAVLDMRRFDAVCNPGEPGLTLERGECCDYVLRLEVWDDTICPHLSGGHHQWPHTFPFRLCNDLE